MSDWLLRRAEKLIGCGFSVEHGPDADLDFAAEAPRLGRGGGPPDQFFFQKLASLDRMFRDLAINPVAVALIRYMVGARDTRFSSHRAFIKWQGEYGYGPNLGMHCDQISSPLPWGRTALTANTNWCLTEYTQEGGAFAYVPASHRAACRPIFPEAVDRAVPIFAPKGSLIVFHGATWHGAYPRTIPGMRLMSPTTTGTCIRCRRKTSAIRSSANWRRIGMIRRCSARSQASTTCGPTRQSLNSSRSWRLGRSERSPELTSTR